MSGAVKLGQFVKASTKKNKGLVCTDVYSVTNSAGFVPSTEYFSKEVFSSELSGYKVVDSGAIAYNPSRINVGSVAVQDKCETAIVSPLYVVFKVDENVLLPEYVCRFLKSGPGQAQIAFRSSGTVRNNLKYDALCEMTIPLPSLEEQTSEMGILGGVEQQIGLLQLRQNKLDELVKSRFSWEVAA